MTAILCLKQQPIVSGNPAVVFVQEEHVMKIIKLFTKLDLPCYPAIVRVIDVPRFPNRPRDMVADIVKIHNLLRRTRAAKAVLILRFAGRPGLGAATFSPEPLSGLRSTGTRAAPALAIPERLTGILI